MTWESETEFQLPAETIPGEAMNEDAVCKHCHKVIRTVPKHYCPRSPNQTHEPVESQTGTAGSILASVDQLTEPPEPSEPGFAIRDEEAIGREEDADIHASQPPYDEDTTATGEFIDLTPRGMTTLEGQLRVARAQKAFEDATAEVANLATQFLDDAGPYLSFPTEDFGQAFNELEDAITFRRARQEAFLRAVAGAPEQS